jgi:hypothetical protein
MSLIHHGGMGVGMCPRRGCDWVVHRRERRRGPSAVKAGGVKVPAAQPWGDAGNVCARRNGETLCCPLASEAQEEVGPSWCYLGYVQPEFRNICRLC